jgi:hypothetical protein
MPDWSRILSTFIPLLTLIILPLLIKKFKKNTTHKTDDLYQHLQSIGIKTSIKEKDGDTGKIGLAGKFSSQKSEGLIELQNSNTSFINIVADSTQYGVNYYLDYLVKNPNLLQSYPNRKSKLVRKRASILRGKTIDLEWKGDAALVQILNSDYRIKDRLFQGGFESIKGNIWIYPELKHSYYRIRSTYFLPTRQIFDAIDIIAKHLKSYKLY